MRRRNAIWTIAAIAGAILGRRTSARESVNHTVEIRDFEFSPRRLRVRLGDTVTWTNLDIVPHTATGKDLSWDTNTLGTGESRTVVVHKTMERHYYCRFHPAMLGELVLDRHD